MEDINSEPSAAFSKLTSTLEEKHFLYIFLMDQ